MNCARCGEELTNGIYLGDFLAGIVGKFKPWDSVDLCEECHIDIILIIENWWNKKEKD